MTSTKRSYHGQLDEYLHRLIAYELTKNDENANLTQTPSDLHIDRLSYQPKKIKRTVPSYRNVNTKVIYFTFALKSKYFA